MRKLPSLLLALVVVVVAACRLAAQEAVATNQPLAVYLDCESSGCDFDYFRTELTMVNWVRDRQVADVHILVTSQSTGASGREYTATFIGLRQFAGVVDTLKFVSLPEATQDDRRKGLARIFRLGLVRYLTHTAAESRLTVNYQADTNKSGTQTKAKKDPWNYWVLQQELFVNANGEETYKSYYLNGGFSANRVTENWKTQFNINQSYNESKFQVDPTQPDFVNIQRNNNVSLLQVKSLTQHWSAGFRGRMGSSTYDNSRRAIQLFPALEYNIFPYKQSTRRQLTFEYNIGVADYRYADTTVFDKVKESMALQRLLIGVATREPWGSIDLGTTAIHYFNGRKQYRINNFLELSLRLVKGLSLQGFGSYTKIEDQFALAKKDFTPEQILTRQFQLGTSYRYFGYFSLRYTFGSIYNNVVNPRMGSGFFD
jgi:hypothetical protein